MPPKTLNVSNNISMFSNLTPPCPQARGSPAWQCCPAARPRSPGSWCPSPRARWRCRRCAFPPRGWTRRWTPAWAATCSCRRQPWQREGTARVGTQPEAAVAVSVSCHFHGDAALNGSCRSEQRCWGRTTRAERCGGYQPGALHVSSGAKGSNACQSNAWKFRKQSCRGPGIAVAVTRRHLMAWCCHYTLAIS